MRAHTPRLAVPVVLLILASPCCGDGGGGGPDARVSADVGAIDASAATDDAASAEDAAGSIVDAGTDAGPGPDAGPRECPPVACDAPLPALGDTQPWRHTFATPITVRLGSARHRGRDLYLREGDPQWALAKFAYGLGDDDLKDEDVDLYLLRGCGTRWETLGTATTTNDGAHATVEGVEDTGGRVFFEIPEPMRLEVGRHRIVFVVQGDHTIAEQFIEVLPPDARFVVTDVDGTQTESETAAWGSLLTGTGPASQPSGADALWAFARRGYHVFYLTARPEWLEPRTHAWLAEEGYPPGLVHTTLGGTGATGAPAEEFKSTELASHVARFPDAIAYGVGNTDTDAASYASIGLPPERIVSYRFDAGAVATRMDDYAELVTIAEAMPSVCGP
jgi:hypothetical protein